MDLESPLYEEIVKVGGHVFKNLAHIAKNDTKRNTSL
jgi:hypothetical protein